MHILEDGHSDDIGRRGFLEVNLLGVSVVAPVLLQLQRDPFPDSNEVNNELFFYLADNSLALSEHIFTEK